MTEIVIWKNTKNESISFPLSMANRHGLIRGATGTGKTVTLQILSEQFSKAGIPVFSADVKGDLAGISQIGIINKKIQDRLDKLQIKEFTPLGNKIIRGILGSIFKK